MRRKASRRDAARGRAATTRTRWWAPCSHCSALGRCVQLLVERVGALREEQASCAVLCGRPQSCVCALSASEGAVQSCERPRSCVCA
jgi:hypothetical protein